MGTQQELTTEQEQILCILDNEEGLRDALDESNDWIYIHALENYAYSEAKIDKILEVLKYLHYVDDDNKITAQGTYYLQQTSANNTIKLEKENKRANLDFGVKIVGGIVALLGTLIATILTVYNAFKN